jgi:hypothetical protein
MRNLKKMPLIIFLLFIRFMLSNSISKAQWSTFGTTPDVKEPGNVLIGATGFKGVYTGGLGLEMQTSGSTIFQMYSGVSGSNLNNLQLVSFPSYGYCGILAGAAGTNSQLPFIIQNGGAERFRIGTNGNVGIGTTAPSTLLDLKRDGGATDRNVQLKLNNTWNAGGSALNEPTIIFDNGTTSTTYGTYGWSIGAQVAGTAYFRIGKYSGSTPTFSEYFRIKDDGKVVIGDIMSFTYGTPTGYQLYVKTGILTEKIKVASSGDATNWSDFVFDKSYKLRSLKEIETFIQKNHHLPEIPSAEEVKKNGVDLLEMDAKLLQKIEELTLYMIEMKKEITSLKEDNKVLRAKITK